MKAEHRHQLQTNALADRLGRLVQGMKSAPRSTTTLVWVLVFLALAAFAVWEYATGATRTERSALWTSVAKATRDPGGGTDALQRIASDNPGSIAGRAARFQLARSNLQQGVEWVVGEPARALPLLKEARKLYSELLADCVDAPLLAQEALMGKATAEETLAGIAEPPSAEQGPGAAKPEQAHETKSAGSLDKALEDYRALAISYPNSILGKQAAERAQALEASRSQIEQFYAEANSQAAPKLNKPAAKSQ